MDKLLKIKISQLATKVFLFATDKKSLHPTDEIQTSIENLITSEKETTRKETLDELLSRLPKVEKNEHSCEWKATNEEIINLIKSLRDEQ